MEYLIVFSVMAMMTAYVWILARCLQHAKGARGENANIVVVLNTGSRESFAMINK